RRNPTLAARGQADDCLLQEPVARSDAALSTKPRDALQRTLRRIQAHPPPRLRGYGNRVSLLARGQDEQNQAALRRSDPQPGAPLSGERKRVYQEPAQSFHEPGRLRWLPWAAPQAGDSGGDARWHRSGPA